MTTALTALFRSFVALPLFVALLLRVSPAQMASRGWPSSVVLDALRLSLVTSGAATAIVAFVGTPVAWLLATTREFPGKRVLEVLLDLPMVLPPTVAGFGPCSWRSGAWGCWLAPGAFGVSLPFTTAAVIVAQVFMAALFFGPARGICDRGRQAVRSPRRRCARRSISPLSGRKACWRRRRCGRAP